MYYITFSKKLSKNTQLNKLLHIKYCTRYHISTIKNSNGIIFWKYKQKLTQNIANKYEKNILYLEDAPISSISNKKGKLIKLGFYINKNGHYYNSKIKNSLRTKNKNKLTLKQIEETRNYIEKIIKYRITKYNKLSDIEIFDIKPNAASILLIDQKINDNSIIQNENSIEDFKKMYNHAIKNAKGKKIYVKLVKNGYLKSIISKTQCNIIPYNINIHSILEKIENVYVISSQVGFEALMHKKTVHCFGNCYYSNFGLTIDYKTNNIKYHRTLEEIFYILYIKSCQYVIEKETTLDKILNVIITNKKIYNIDHNKRFFIFSTNFWHQVKFYNFLYSKKLFFCKSLKKSKKLHINSNDISVTWSGFYDNKKDFSNFLMKNNIPIWKMEDGFIRSKGLGSCWEPSNSFCLDTKGIYFNAREESDIENMIQYANITEEEKKLSQNLINIIVDNNITKYNLDYIDKQEEENITHIKKIKNKKIILIPAQVNNDKSLLYGSFEIDNNIDLIKIVRKKNPKSIIILKQHPDCIMGNRGGFVSKKIYEPYIDYNFHHTNISKLISISDEIHTITSLTGVESLIRNKKVICYGAPFYSQCGLTKDYSIVQRRKKQRTIDELIYITYFLYPRYYSYNLNIFITPFETIDSILLNKINSNKYNKATIWRKKLYNLLKLYINKYKF